MNELISILVPVYNCEDYLRECIESVINQSYPNLQIVVINDGSTDKTREIADRYAEKDSRIEVYHQPNQGVASARNRLLEKIKGEYFLFVDADDWLESDAVSFLHKKIKESETDIAICEKRIEKANPQTYQEEIWDKDKTIEEFLKHKRLNGALWNKLIKTELIQDTRFRSDIFYGEDALFVWNLIQRTKKLIITNQPLYNHRANPESLSNQNWTPDRKGTGHIVWETICNDVKKNYPTLLGTANSRFALEDMWGLYFASLCGYKKDEHIKVRQKNIWKHRKDLKTSKLDGMSKYLVALLLSKWYGFGKILRLMRR